MQSALERQQGCLLHQDRDIIMKVTRTLKSIFPNLKKSWKAGKMALCERGYRRSHTKELEYPLCFLRNFL